MYNPEDDDWIETIDKDEEDDDENWDFEPEEDD
jgi:hypothetical protein